MSLQNEIVYHSLAANYILNNMNEKDLCIFENEYVNKCFIDLLKESKSLYKKLEKKSSIQEITLSLDKKRDLTKQFKFLTGINWRL